MGGFDDQAGGVPASARSNGRSPSGRSSNQHAPLDGARPPTKSVLRRIGPGSVLKVSVVFYLALYCILLVAAVLLWLAATATGLRGNIEDVIADMIASGKFHFVGSELLRASAIGGVMLVVFGTAANVMLAVLYNLISDLVGGVSIAVDERPAKRTRRADRPERRPGTEPAHRSGTEPARRPVAQPGPRPGPQPERQPVTQSTTRQPTPEPPHHPGTEPPLHPGSEPGPTPRADPPSPRILIPEIELRQSRPQPMPEPRPEVVTEQRSDAKPETNRNLEAFGL